MKILYAEDERALSEAVCDILTLTTEPWAFLLLL